MNIKDIRIKLDMTQAEFAKEYGFPLRTLQSWEAGERKPAQYIMDLLMRTIVAESRGGNKMNIVHLTDELSIAFTAWEYEGKTHHGYAEFLGGPNGYITMNSFQNGGRRYGDAAECYERLDEEEYFGDLADIWNMILDLDELDDCFDVTDFELK